MKIKLLVLWMFLSLLGNAQVLTEQPDSLLNAVEKRVKAMLNHPDLRNAAVSLDIMDVNTGKAVARHNPRMSLVPASTMKLFSTSSALEVLGPNYRFETRLEYTGDLDSNGVLHGDLIIRGGGDPTLGSKYFVKDDPSLFLKEWVKVLKDSGIREIKGRVIADADIYNWEMVPSTWAWGDMGNGYGAAPSGLTVYDNTCVLSFRSGPNAGDSAIIECVNPYIPDLTFVNEVKASNVSRDNSYIFGAPYMTERYVKGAIPKGKEEFMVKGSIPDPSYLLAFELTYALVDSGVVVSNSPETRRNLRLKGQDVPSERKKIFSHYSPPLSQVVYWTNLVSVNLFAEHLINQLGVVKYGDGSPGSGSVAIIEQCKRLGVDVRGLYVSDGSGLSRFNGVSAEHMVQLLKGMNKSSNFKTFEGSLSIAGKAGTLSHLCKGTKAQGRIKAKSGTMTRVKSYAGYVDSTSGKKLAFAVIVNNFEGSTREMEKLLEKVMVSMASF